MSKTKSIIYLNLLCLVFVMTLSGCATESSSSAKTYERPDRHGQTIVDRRGTRRPERPTEPVSQPVVAKIEKKAPIRVRPAAAVQRPAITRTAPPAGMSHTSLAFPTGKESTSAILLEKSGPPEIRMGQAYDYDIVVKNLTDMTLEEVVVEDTLGDNFALKSSNPPFRSNAAGKATWLLGSLRPNESRTIRVSGSPMKAGVVTTCSSVTYASQACLTSRVVSPKLKLEKRAPSEVLTCDPIPLTFVVSNIGTGTIDNVTIQDKLPAGMTTKTGERTITLRAGTLKAGESKEMKATVQATRTGSFQNTAQASASGDLTTSSNTTTTRVREPVLALTKSGPKTTYIGRNIEYTLTVTNTSDVAAKDTIVEDTLPANTNFVSASHGGKLSGGKVIWRLGSLSPSDSKKLTLTTRGSSAGTARNTSSAKAYCAKRVSAQALTEVTGIPAILLETVDLEDPTKVGDEVVYRITVTNQGSAEGTNIKIACALESGMQYVASSGATSSRSASASNPLIQFAPLPSLAPKAKATWTVRVKALAAGDVRFKISMTSDQSKRPVEETESSFFYE